jgi:hypothetical protein
MSAHCVSQADTFPPTWPIFSTPKS